MDRRIVRASDLLVNIEPDDVLTGMRLANQIIHVCGSQGRRLPPVLASGSEGMGDDANSQPRDYVGEVSR